MIQLPTDFRATLESYRGPLDLLLYLIKREELDVFDIPIARITEQYMLYLGILKNVDPNTCGEFLVTAAQLMEIKSKMLLPTELAEDEDEEFEDPRLELVLQLLEYKKYKERALLLEQRADEHRRKYRRPHQGLGEFVDEGEDTGPINIGSVSIWDLLTAFQRVQLTLRLREPHRILFEDRPIEEYIAAIERKFALAGPQAPGGARRVLFDDLFRDSRTRYDAVGFLLAILEMAKQATLRFSQDEVFGPIYLEPVDPAEQTEDPSAADPPAETEVPEAPTAAQASEESDDSSGAAGGSDVTT